MGYKTAQMLKDTEDLFKFDGFQTIQFVCNLYALTFELFGFFIFIYLTCKPHHNTMCSYLYISSALFTDISLHSTPHLVLMTYLVKQIPRKNI